MLCFTLVSMKTYNDMAFCAVKDIPVVPITDRAKDTLIDILFTQWPKDATLGLVVNIPDENIEKFSYYKMNQEDAFDVPKDHYAGYICRKVDGTIHEAGKDFKGISIANVLSSRELIYLLAPFNSEFLLCKVKSQESLDIFVSRRIEMLRERVFNTSVVDAEDVNSLLHMLETFCVLNSIDKECLDWCRENCPPALRFSKDSEIVSCMCTAWLSHIKGQL